MDTPALPWEGGCRCGKVRFRITERPLLTMACHCTGCQKMTASAYSLSLAIPSEGLLIITGDTEPGGLHADGQDHRHCGWCKSWLFTRVSPEFGFVNVRATMLDDARWFAPFIETMTREALPWAKTSALHSFDGFPEMADYARLTEAFAAW